jgi:hypothetical protein
MKILALDPGKVNFGYSILEANKRGHFKVLKNGTLKDTIQDLKLNLYESVIMFENEVDTLIAEFNVTHIVGERFVSRGLLGSLSEYVNIMLGICAAKSSVNFMLIIPATWKNQLKKKLDLELLYRELKVTKHEIDAVMIGVYYVDLMCNKQPYRSLLNNLDSVKKQIMVKK